MRQRLIGLLLTLLLLPGCWSYRDINNLALVMAVGIDRTESGKILVTAQIARPSSGAMGGGGGAGGTKEAPVYVASAEGRSIFEAIRNLALFTSRRVMWAHNKVIVIGRSQAEYGVTEIVDFFTRNPELRFRTLITLAEKDARGVVSENTGMESQPAASIENTFRYAAIIGETQQVDMKEFTAAYFDPGLSSVLPILKRRVRTVPGTAAKDTDPVEIVAQGMGLFRHGRLAGMLGQQESRGVSLLRGKARRVIITLPCAGTETITAELLNQRVQVRPKPARDGHVIFHIPMRIRAGITSVGCDLDYRDPQALAALERKLARSLQRDIEAAVAKSQATLTDPAGLGQHVRAKLPALWQRLGPTWPDHMDEAEFDVTVKVKIIGAELTVEPPKVEKEKRRSDEGKSTD